MKIKMNRLLKGMSLFGTLFIVSSLLSGCAGMLHRLGYARQLTPTAQTCASTPMLITNLAENSHERHYQLSTGYRCPEINYYEEAKRQAEAAAQQHHL